MIAYFVKKMVMCSVLLVSLSTVTLVINEQWHSPCKLRKDHLITVSISTLKVSEICKLRT